MFAYRLGAENNKFGLSSTGIFGFQDLENEARTPGTYTHQYKAVNATATFDVRFFIALTAATGSVTIDNISVKEVRTVDTDVDAALAIFDVPHDAEAMSFRFRTGADADINIVNMYATRGDHYELAATFSVIGGKQLDEDVGVFCDTLTIFTGTETWPTVMKASSQATDSIAMLSLKTHGATKFLFIATTLASSLLVEGVTH